MKSERKHYIIIIRKVLTVNVGVVSSVAAHQMPSELRRPLWGQYGDKEDEDEICTALTSPVDTPRGMPHSVAKSEEKKHIGCSLPWISIVCHKCLIVSQSVFNILVCPKCFIINFCFCPEYFTKVICFL